MQGQLKHGKDISESSSAKPVCMGTGRQEKEDDGWKEKLNKNINFGLSKSTRIHSNGVLNVETEYFELCFKKS